MKHVNGEPWNENIGDEIIEPKVRVEDADWWREVRNVITDMLCDHRINGEVRAEYRERIRQVQG